MLVLPATAASTQGTQFTARHLHALNSDSKARCNACGRSLKATNKRTVLTQRQSSALPAG